MGKRLPRVTVPDFDYAARAGARLEIPIAERIAAIRAKKAEDRARAKAKTRRRAADAAERGGRGGPPPAPSGVNRGGRDRTGRGGRGGGR